MASIIGSFLNPVHKLSWTALLVSNLIEFFVKEVIFCHLDHFFEFLLVFQQFWLSFLIKILLTVIIPPSFEVLHDVNFPKVLMLYIINICSKGIYNLLKYVATKNWVCLEIFDKFYQFFNKAIFFLTILGKNSFHCVPQLLIYWQR